eukprot:m51a1_g7515 hypothetical protein (309) ;mRNA; f:92-1018
MKKARVSEPGVSQDWARLPVPALDLIEAHLPSASRGSFRLACRSWSSSRHLSPVAAQCLSLVSAARHGDPAASLAALDEVLGQTERAVRRARSLIRLSTKLAVVPAALKQYLDCCPPGSAEPVEQLLSSAWVHCGDVDLQEVPVRCLFVFPQRSVAVAVTTWQKYYNASAEAETLAWGTLLSCNRDAYWATATPLGIEEDRRAMRGDLPEWSLLCWHRFDGTQGKRHGGHRHQFWPSAVEELRQALGVPSAVPTPVLLCAFLNSGHIGGEDWLPWEIEDWSRFSPQEGRRHTPNPDPMEAHSQTSVEP